jgi:hypothetical protein
MCWIFSQFEILHLVILKWNWGLFDLYQVNNVWDGYFIHFLDSHKYSWFHYNLFDLKLFPLFNYFKIEFITLDIYNLNDNVSWWPIFRFINFIDMLIYCFDYIYNFIYIKLYNIVDIYDYNIYIYKIVKLLIILLFYKYKYYNHKYQYFNKFNYYPIYLFNLFKYK